MKAERRNENEWVKKNKKKARETRRLKNHWSVIIENRHIVHFFAMGLIIKKKSSTSVNIISLN